MGIKLLAGDIIKSRALFCKLCVRDEGRKLKPLKEMYFSQLKLLNRFYTPVYKKGIKENQNKPMETTMLNFFRC